MWYRGCFWVVFVGLSAACFVPPRKPQHLKPRRHLRHHSNILNATLRSHAHLLAPRYDLMPLERIHLQTQVKDIPFPGISPAICTMQITSAHLHIIATPACPRRIFPIRLSKHTHTQRPGVWPRLTSIDSGNFPALNWDARALHLPDCIPFNTMLYDDTYDHWSKDSSM